MHHNHKKNIKPKNKNHSSQTWATHVEISLGTRKTKRESSPAERKDKGGGEKERKNEFE
jgi:hypothetical protein